MLDSRHETNIGRAGHGQTMTHRRATAILRRWSSYDSQTLAKAEAVNRSRAALASPGSAAFALLSTFGGVLGLMAIAHFLGQVR